MKDSKLAIDLEADIPALDLVAKVWRWYVYLPQRSCDTYFSDSIIIERLHK